LIEADGVLEEGAVTAIVINRKNGVGPLRLKALRHGDTDQKVVNAMYQ
jgi:hypothetical protein